MSPVSGPVTADGCPVDLYRLLPPAGEAEIVHAAIAPGADVLDLGAGTGRIAHRLVDLGHDVVAVDQSADMLAHVRGAETVRAPIMGLRLDRRFAAVLAASRLVNVPADDERSALLDTVAAHLGADGVAVLEWSPPEWFDAVCDGAGGLLGAVRCELTGPRRRGDLLDATVVYTCDQGRWEHAFTTRRLSEATLHRSLADAGLRRERWLTGDRTWFAVRRTCAGTG